MLSFKSVVCALGLGVLADAQVPVSLGSASAYAVFASSAITNTGETTIGAKIGISKGTSITGFPPGVYTGEDINNDASTVAAADLLAAYNAIAALPITTDLTGSDLGGLTLGPGIYGFTSSAGLTGVLTLDGQNSTDGDATFIFKFGSTLTTASAAVILLTNGANACNVYWQVGSSATLGVETVFNGNVLAQASITATTGSSLVGGGFYALDVVLRN
ncbi:hypothetical protein LTR36_010031 [Oleoguttula mirabilis]|uniref:DUF3494 domain-containing protein n=1 Tax=Oleoguttula mirabilis TaxID=1507867 RepID=A0AAV9JSX6_9PEZI|nr:hypothetical protein LTR36_010031 [Oleoguttula mirabilis]